MMHEHTRCQCDVCKVSHFERNNYFHGKLLSARDLADEQRYFNEKRWLINRMVLGWGVVCGLDVSIEGGCLVVKPGLALDCCGHELLVCAQQTLQVNKFAEALGISSGGAPEYLKPATPAGYTEPPKPSKPTGYEPPTTPPEYPKPPEYTSPPGYTEPEPIRWALCLEYRECQTEPVKLPPSCEQKERGREHNRIRDDYKLSIRPWKDACPEDHSEDRCPYEGLGRGTALHKALVSRSLECGTCEECECVLLAVGMLETRTGQPPQVRLDDDSWKYRRIVYTNPALGGLIRCLHGGLAHIETINWIPGSHYETDEFLDRLCHEHLKVTFDQPMRARTVTNVRSCRLSIFLSIGDGSCPVQFLIPVDRIEYTDRTATYYFDDDCIEHELRKACKRLKKPVDVELILHGNMIHNSEGRALDAELIDELPTGNGVEGGEFVAYFTVGP
jgi:hypothetical protein